MVNVTVNLSPSRVLKSNFKREVVQVGNGIMDFCHTGNWYDIYTSGVFSQRKKEMTRHD